jgi:hypothetical protein
MPTSIDGLFVLVEQELKRDPFGSALCTLVNRQRETVSLMQLP